MYTLYIYTIYIHYNIYIYTMIITITCKHTLTSVLSKNRLPENDHLVQQRHQENQAMMREGGSCRKKNEGALEVMIVGINNDMKWG